MASCDDLRLELAATQAERDGVAAEVISDRGDLAELESEASHVNPDLLAAARARKTESEAHLRQLDEKLSSLRSELVANNCLVMQPAEILQIQFDNPTEVRNVDALFAQVVALGQQDPSTILGGRFPSRDAQQEWKQVLPADLTNTAAHEEDQEGSNLVGASGWALDPHYSGGDVPFTHPFGFDWEFMFALDRPTEEPDKYTFLLTPANQSCKEEGFSDAVAQAGDAQDGHGNPIIPRGPDGLPSLLGMEIDGGLVPLQFTDMAAGGVEPGDRVAVFGRWIVDCGHQIPITECADPPRDVHPGETAFRTEIHPPLLMAAARVTSGHVATPAALNADQLTRVLVTSRPYLVSQRFTTDTGTVYDDLADDDGPFFAHMVREVVKVNETILGIPLSSIQVEAHPKIKSLPFVGTHRIQLVVRPPAPNPLVGHGPLAVAFQFTVRRGCTVEVRPGDGDSINVVITLSSDGYQAPRLPARHERTWSKDELGALNTDSADAITLGEAISAGFHLIVSGGGIMGAAEAIAVLKRGIVTDEYDTNALTAANILDASQAIKGPASNIPNLDIQAQLAQLQQERATTAVEVQSDEGDLAELQSESQHVNPAIIAKAVARLNADRARLKELDQQIAALQNTPVGVVQNDDQQFPVFGWVEVGYLTDGKDGKDGKDNPDKSAKDNKDNKESKDGADKPGKDNKDNKESKDGADKPGKDNKDHKDGPDKQKENKGRKDKNEKGEHPREVSNLIPTDPPAESASAAARRTEEPVQHFISVELRPDLSAAALMNESDLAGTPAAELADAFRPPEEQAVTPPTRAEPAVAEPIQAGPARAGPAVASGGGGGARP